MNKQRTTGRGDKLYLPPSCAGCPFHEMILAEKQGPDGKSLFNHFCTHPDHHYDIAPLFEEVAQIAPKKPDWCQEKRPELWI